MKETAAQYSGPFANFIVQNLQQSIVKISFPEQDRHNIPWPQQHTPEDGPSCVPDSSINENQMQAWSVGCVFLVTAFYFLISKLQSMKKSKSVSRHIAMNTKNEALFTMFCNENMDYSETWKEKQTLRLTDWVPWERHRSFLSHQYQLTHGNSVPLKPSVPSLWHEKTRGWRHAT